MMILVTILIEIILIALAGFITYESLERDSLACGGLAVLIWVLIMFMPSILGAVHGYINYNPSFDKDLARITAVTQEQDFWKTYYKVEVEYLTNTPTQQGVIQNYNIEKDVFYCYYTDNKLVEKLKNNMYKELWIITGYKGGYETYKDFGTHLIKDIELREGD